MSKAIRHKPKYSIADLIYHIPSEDYYLVEDITVDMMGQQWYHLRDLAEDNTTTHSCYAFDKNGTVRAV